MQFLVFCCLFISGLFTTSNALALKRGGFDGYYNRQLNYGYSDWSHGHGSFRRPFGYRPYGKFRHYPCLKCQDPGWINNYNPGYPGYASSSASASASASDGGFGGLGLGGFGRLSHSNSQSHAHSESATINLGPIQATYSKSHANANSEVAAGK